MIDRQKLLSIPINVDKNILLVGCGGIGWHAATIFVMAGVKHLSLVDYDNIDGTNLRRLPVSPKYLGQKKVAILTDYLRSLERETEIVPFDLYIDEVAIERIIAISDSLGYKYDAIVSVVDNDAADKVVLDTCHKYNIKYVRTSYDDSLISFCTKSGKILVTGGNGYSIIPSWAGGAYMAASLAAYLTLCDEYNEIYPTSFNINNLIKGEVRSD